MKSFKIFLTGLLICIGIIGGFVVIIGITRELRQNYTFSPIVPLLGFLLILILPIVFFHIAFKLLNTQENPKKEKDEEKAGEKDE